MGKTKTQDPPTFVGSIQDLAKLVNSHFDALKKDLGLLYLKEHDRTKNGMLTAINNISTLHDDVGYNLEHSPKITTQVGHFQFFADNATDEMILQEFSQLIQKIQPVDLYERLKSINK